MDLNGRNVLMNQIDRAVEKCMNAAQEDDDEVAHSAEDEAMRLALRWIAEQPGPSAALASYVLKNCGGANFERRSA